MASLLRTASSQLGKHFTSKLNIQPSLALSLQKQTLTLTQTAALPQSASVLLTQTCSMGTKAMLKTNKAAAKRIRVRGSGSVKRNKGGFSHNTGYKTRQRSNNTGQTTGIKGKAIEKRMRRLIGK